MAFKLSSPFHLEKNHPDSRSNRNEKLKQKSQVTIDGEAGWEADDKARKNKTGIYAPKKRKKASAIKTPKAAKINIGNKKAIAEKDVLDSTPKISTKKPTAKTASKTSREAKREDRKNARKAKRNARLDKKIARQTKKGKEAGDGAEKGINSKALAKRRRVDKLKARKAKNNKK